MNDNKFLQNAYVLKTKDQVQNLYSDWAASYDEELAENGYASPRRIAQALVVLGVPRDTLILDIGCGTGVSGEYLKAVGFANLHGSDFSTRMLQQANEKNLYQRLYHTDFEQPFDFISEPYRIMTAVGIFAPGHADPNDMLSMISLMPQGGIFAFSVNDHALDDADYLRFIHLGVKNRELRIRWQEYGDHITGIGLNSLIFVLERL